jgi:hypothetical protein
MLGWKGRHGPLFDRKSSWDRLSPDGPIFSPVTCLLVSIFRLFQSRDDSRLTRSLYDDYGDRARI